MSTLLPESWARTPFRERLRRPRVLVIGRDSAQAAWLAANLAEHDYFVHSVMAEAELAMLQQAVADVDTVAVADGIANRNAIVVMCERMARSVLLVPDTVDLLLHSARTTRVGDLLIYESRKPGLTRAQKVMKRAADMLLALSIAPIAVPVMLAVAAVIRLCSSGPVIFRQERVGENGKPFALLKFRTMMPRAEDLTGPVMAAEDDPRTTSIGRLLRGSHLDELPQLFNVIQGEMSIVGPRPERPCFTREFSQSVQNYELRHVVKPGITGLAQVKGAYATSAAAKLRFDLTYIFCYSLLLDLRILVLTLSKLFDGLAKRRTPVALPVDYQGQCQVGD